MLEVQDTTTRDWNNPTMEQAREVRDIVDKTLVDRADDKVKNITRGNGEVGIQTEGSTVLTTDVLNALLEAGYVVNAVSTMSNTVWVKPIAFEEHQEERLDVHTRDGEVIEEEVVESETVVRAHIENYGDD